MLYFHFITFCKGSLEDKMLEGVNEYREQNRKPPLKLNQKLNEAAQKQADYMLKIRRYTHDGPAGGETFDIRMNNAGYQWNKSAENVAQNSGNEWYDTLSKWIRSPGHNANILGDYEDIGIASAVDGEGKERYWAQVFGTSSDKQPEKLTVDVDMIGKQKEPTANTGDSKPQDVNKDQVTSDDKKKMSIIRSLKKPSDVVKRVKQKIVDCLTKKPNAGDDKKDTGTPDKPKDPINPADKPMTSIDDQKPSTPGVQQDPQYIAEKPKTEKNNKEPAANEKSKDPLTDAIKLDKLKEKDAGILDKLKDPAYIEKQQKAQLDKKESDKPGQKDPSNMNEQPKIVDENKLGLSPTGQNVPANADVQPKTQNNDKSVDVLNKQQDLANSGGQPKTQNDDLAVDVPKKQQEPANFGGQPKTQNDDLAVDVPKKQQDPANVNGQPKTQNDDKPVSVANTQQDPANIGGQPSAQNEDKPVAAVNTQQNPAKIDVQIKTQNEDKAVDLQEKQNPPVNVVEQPDAKNVNRDAKVIEKPGNRANVAGDQKAQGTDEEYSPPISSKALRSNTQTMLPCVDTKDLDNFKFLKPSGNKKSTSKPDNGCDDSNEDVNKTNDPYGNDKSTLSYKSERNNNRSLNRKKVLLDDDEDSCSSDNQDGSPKPFIGSHKHGKGVQTRKLDPSTAIVSSCDEFDCVNSHGGKRRNQNNMENPKTQNGRGMHRKTHSGRNSHKHGHGLRHSSNNDDDSQSSLHDCDSHTDLTDGDDLHIDSNTGPDMFQHIYDCNDPFNDLQKKHGGNYKKNDRQKSHHKKHLKDDRLKQKCIDFILSDKIQNLNKELESITTC